MDSERAIEWPSRQTVSGHGCCSSVLREKTLGKRGCGQQFLQQLLFPEQTLTFLIFGRCVVLVSLFPVEDVKKPHWHLSTFSLPFLPLALATSYLNQPLELIALAPVTTECNTRSNPMPLLTDVALVVRAVGQSESRADGRSRIAHCHAIRPYLPSLQHRHGGEIGA